MITTGIIAFSTIIWNIVDAVSNLEFIAQKAGYQNELTAFLTSPATPKIAFLLAFSGLVFTLLFRIERDKLEQPNEELKQFHETPEYDLTPKEIADVKPISIKKSEERIIADVTPEYLLGFFDEHTKTQADKLMEAYIDKWMVFSGIVNDVVSMSDYRVTVYLEDNGREDNSLTNKLRVGARFYEQKQIDQVTVLTRGLKITVIGQISPISGRIVLLENCEFIR